MPASVLLARAYSMIRPEVKNTMSVTRTPARSLGEIKVLVDSENSTVTFVSSRDADDTIPPTEWLTASSDAVVELMSYR